MLGRRPRVSSLHIPIPTAEPWRTLRPPTPRRSTFPQPGTTSTAMPSAIDLDAPPVPPLSYWEPDTPEAFTSPLSLHSPRNPFLTPPSPPSPSALFPVASPLLPASPLSLFDRVMSPMTPTFLFPRTPPIPLSLRLRAPRTPPLPPRRQAGMQVVKSHSEICSMPYTELGEAQYGGLYEMWEAIRDRVVAEMAQKKRDVAVAATEEDEGPALRMKNGRKQKKQKKLLKRRGFEVVKHVVACV